MAVSLFEVVRRWARTSGDAVAAVDAIGGDRAAVPEVTPSGPPACLTYKALHEAAERLAGAILPLLDPGPGSRRPGLEEALLATWMRRGNGWYCVFCAAARLQIPVMALSGDLPDQSAQRKRNEEVLEAHRPALVIFDDTAQPSSLAAGSRAAFSAPRAVAFSELWSQACAIDRRPAAEAVATADATLCYCYTGGTTKASRCARVTHRMALHEVAAYPRILNMGNEDSVLQQHSLYWAASAYGEVDIALAFGCALVFCEAWDAEGVASAVRANSVTCAGLVPSMLAALEPRDVPSLRVALTWGEALQPRVAREWAERVQLLDLLISTECWLSLYADWTAEVKKSKNGTQGQGERPPFVALPEVEVRLQPVAAEEGPGAVGSGHSSSNVGELLVSGPMVSPGYSDAALSAETFVERDGAGLPWYRTRDCLERRPDGGLVFAGRADDLVKVAGIWVDIRDVEAKLASVEGVSEACICGRRAFVALTALSPGVMHSLRAVLPSDFVLFLAPAPLPRNAGTGKVDRRRLAELAETGASCPASKPRDEKERRLCVEELSSLLCWYRPFYAVVAASLLRAGYDSLPLPCLLPRVGWSWASSLAVDLPQLVLPFGLRVLRELVWRLSCSSYVVLFNFHHYEFMRASLQRLPIGMHTLAVTLGSLAPSPFYGLVFAAPGMFLATRHGRLLSWPLVCATGFPIWARELGCWLTDSIRDHGYLGTAHWFLWWKALHFGRSGVRRGVAALKKARRRLERCLGRTRMCGWCKELKPASYGYMDTGVAARWYCEKCWDNYYKYYQCGRCKKYTKKDFLTKVNNAKVCGPCRETLCAEAAKDADQKRAADGRLDAGTENGRGRKRPMIEITYVKENLARCTFSLETNSGPDQGLGGATSETKQAVEVPPSPAAKKHKSREWRLIERSTGLTFNSLTDPLAGIDSLRRTKMASVFRREMGKRLPREVLVRSNTLGELVNELARLPEDVEAPVPSGRAARRGYAAWGMMWHSKCPWTLRRSKALPEAAFRTAITQLVERHEALRTEMRDPYTLFKGVQQALTGLELWRRHLPDLLEEMGAMKAVRRFLGHRAASALSRAGFHAATAFGRAVRWSFRNAWPRAGATTAVRPELRVLRHTSSPEEAEQELYNNTRTFNPPFEVLLAPYGGPGARSAQSSAAAEAGPAEPAGGTSEVPGASGAPATEGAFVRLLVTHMFSDGYSVVPLLSDLAQLVARAEQAGNDNGENSVPPLPPVPSSLATLERRLHRTIDGELAADGGDGGITREPVGRPWGPTAYTVYAYLPAEAVATIRRAAGQLAVPEDVAMLAGIGAALARFEGCRTQTIAMIVPQRDGPAENEMVGLFADLRHLHIATGGLSYAGVAQRLHHVVENRLWHAPGLATQVDLPMVNFQWTDYQEIHGFSQQVSFGEWPEGVRHSLKVSVEQPDGETWRMRVAMNPEVYPMHRCHELIRLLESCLRALHERPLDLVWPEDAATSSRGRRPFAEAVAPEAAPAED